MDESPLQAARRIFHAIKHNEQSTQLLTIALTTILLELAKEDLNNLQSFIEDTGDRHGAEIFVEAFVRPFI